MDEQLANEVAEIRQTLNDLQTRLERVEEQLIHAKGISRADAAAQLEADSGISALTDVNNTPTQPSKKTSEDVPVKELAGTHSSAPVSQTEHIAVPTGPASLPPDHSAPPTLKRADQPKPGESLETKIGLYWLSRLGIASLVIGMALLLLYSFQYFGALAKVATGILSAVALLGLGEFVERKKGLRWYAQGLMGGGWSLAYFTTYAMHHVAAVRIIDSPIVDMVLLLGVAAGAMWHAVERKSDIIAVLATVLGFVTTSMTEVNYFSVIASALLAVSVSFLSIKMQWYKVLFWGLLSSYLTFFFAVSDSIWAMSIGGSEKLWLLTAYLGTY